jgi:hypothetical protein
MGGRSQKIRTPKGRFIPSIRQPAEKIDFAFALWEGPERKSQEIDFLRE